MLAVAVQRQMATVNLGNRFKELEKAHRKLDDTQRQLIQSERMASVGQLAAGVAHEINNPIGFVISNYETLTEYVDVLNSLLENIPNLENDDSALKKINAIWQEEDVDFIMSDIESLLSASKSGLKRVQDIVAGLKSFSHSDASSYSPISLNDCIEDSIQLVWNELKYNCEVVKTLADTSQIKANFGQIEQVIVNMLINAKHAMEEGGTITIKTWQVNEEVIVTISDTGTGISEKNQEKLFTPFFTTKPVGVGTGLGLSISYGILQDHGADISVESQLGVGTTFKIVFPAYSE
ncbi:ATP-binding protein, partial [Psychrosphaera sp.]|nr:ATP-binding protein [Psychrosphaera sp.]